MQVNPWLNGLVYGESVMNDGVAIVLYRAFATFISQELTASNFFAPLGRTALVLLVSVALGAAVIVLGAVTLRLLHPRDARVEVGCCLGRLLPPLRGDTGSVGACGGSLR